MILDENLSQPTYLQSGRLKLDESTMPNEKLVQAIKNKYKIGMTIKIINMDDTPEYNGRTGIIKFVDDAGQLHGTWGGLAVVPGFDRIEIVSEAEKVEEAMDTTITTQPYDLNIIKDKFTGNSPREWEFVKSFKFQDDAIDRANRMIANGEAYVAQVYSWLNGSKHGEIYFKKADDGTTIDRSIEHRDCDIHGHEHITQTDSTVVMPAAPHPVTEAVKIKKCCICNGDVEGRGNSAAPIKNGICCDNCYSDKILPLRQEKLTRSRFAEFEDAVINYERHIADETATPRISGEDLNVEFIAKKYFSKQELDAVKQDTPDFFYLNIQGPEEMTDGLEELLNKPEETPITESISAGDKDAIITVHSNGSTDIEYYSNYDAACNDFQLAFDEDFKALDILGIAHLTYVDTEWQLDEGTIYNDSNSLAEDKIVDDAINKFLNENAYTPVSQVDGINSGDLRKLYDILDPKSDDEKDIILNKIAKINLDLFNELHDLLHYDSASMKLLNEINHAIEDFSNTYIYLDEGDRRIVVIDSANSNELHAVAKMLNIPDSDIVDSPVEHKAYVSAINKFNESFDTNSAEFKKLEEDIFAILEPATDIATETITENNGLATILNTLIKDEFDAIQAYNDAIVNFSAEGRTDLMQVLQDILNEENLHVGQLEILLEQVNGAANSIDQGKAEAETQLATEGGEIVEEDPEEGMHY